MIGQNKYNKLLIDYDKHCQRIAKATWVNIHESEPERKKRKKALEKDYVGWFEYYFPNFAKVKCASFHKKMANEIINNRRIRLLAEIFRSGGKSVHIDMGLPLYLYLVKHDLFFMLLVGETSDKAAQLLSGIQSQLQFNNRIKFDYGERFQQGDWAEGNFSTTDGVRFMSLGFGQNPRGAREQAQRPDYIVVDDVDNKKHVNNDRLMRESVDFITEDIWGTFDAGDKATERFVYANNNFHKNSITNRLREYFQSVIDKNKGKPGRKSATNIRFKIISVKAVKDLHGFQPSWPEKTTADYWREKFDNTPYRSFMREYMHVHVQDGAIFKHEDILFGKPLKLNQYDALCFYGDLSYKANADYKALVLVGKKGREFHILLCYLRQKSRADAAGWLYDTYEKYKLGSFNIRYLIEGLFAQDEFVNDFDEEGDKRGYYIPVVPDKRPKADKYDRIESLCGHFEKHHVFFNEELKTSDQQILIDQFLAFEKGSQAHDDGPDAVHGAFAYVNKRTGKKKNKYAFGRRINNHF